MKVWKKIAYRCIGIALLILLVGYYGKAQCKMLSAAQLKRISKAKYQKKLLYLDHKLASAISIDEDEQKCEYRTYVRCKNYINDTQWHWAEIITLNSCDDKISYSTADQKHFALIRRGLIRKGKRLGKRSYENLDFEVFQNKKGQVMEFNEHPNQQGKMFYLVNLIRN